MIEFESQIVVVRRFAARLANADEGIFVLFDFFQDPGALQDDLDVFLFVAGVFLLDHEDFEELIPLLEFFEIRR